MTLVALALVSPKSQETACQRDAPSSVYARAVKENFRGELALKQRPGLLVDRHSERSENPFVARALNPLGSDLLERPSAPMDPPEQGIAVTALEVSALASVLIAVRSSSSLWFST